VLQGKLSHEGFRRIQLAFMYNELAEIGYTLADIKGMKYIDGMIFIAAHRIKAAAEMENFKKQQQAQAASAMPGGAGIPRV